jgi:hypothetical protein
MHSKSIKVYRLNYLKGSNTDVTDQRGFTKYAVVQASGRIYVPSFITMGVGIQTIL